MIRNWYWFLDDNYNFELMDDYEMTLEPMHNNKPNITYLWNETHSFKEHGRGALFSRSSFIFLGHIGQKNQWFGSDLNISKQ